MKKIGVVAVLCFALSIFGGLFVADATCGLGIFSGKTENAKTYNYEYSDDGYGFYNLTENVKKAGDFTRKLYFEQPIYTGSSRTYDVFFINWVDYARFNEDTYEKYINKFNEVKEFFYIESRGYFDINFNFYVYNSDMSLEFMNNESYQNESNLKFDAHANATLISYYGPGISTLLVGSYPDAIAGGSAHVWGDGTNLAIVPSDCHYYSWVHELYHTLGLPDAYTYFTFKDDEFGGNIIKHDVMSYGIYENTQHPVVNVFDKLALGWLDEGRYDDCDNNAVESINKNGHYVLFAPSNQTNTVAYKLPYEKNDKQSFYLEAREMKGEMFLLVNRYNGQYFNNYDAKNIANARAATLFEISANNNYDIVNQIYNAKGEKLKIIIQNVQFYGDRIEFDVLFNVNSNVLNAQFDISVPNGCAFESIKVYNGDRYVATILKPAIFSVSVVPNAIIRFESENFKTIEYFIPSDFIKKQNEVIKIELQLKNPLNSKNKSVSDLQNEQNQNLCKFNVFVQDNKINKNGNVFMHSGLCSNANFITMYVNNMQYYAGNDIGNRSFDIPNYSQVSFQCNNLTTKTFQYINGCLVDSSTSNKAYPKVVNNENVFSIEMSLNQTYTYNITINMESNANKKLGIKKVLAYNEITKTWDQLTFVGTNQEDGHLVVVLPNSYLYIHIQYENYWEVNEFEIELKYGIYNYTYTLTQNVLQDLLDNFFGLFG